jgi:hypothetical protein
MHGCTTRSVASTTGVKTLRGAVELHCARGEYQTVRKEEEGKMMFDNCPKSSGSFFTDVSRRR